MKKYLLLIAFSLPFFKSIAQVVITPGAQWINSGVADIVFDDIDLINNGSFAPGTSNIKFIGTSDNIIGGNSATGFYKFQIAKTGSAKISLETNITVNNQLHFVSGIVDLNQKNITLANNAALSNENDNSYITGINGGEVITTVNLNAPTLGNPGNMGVLITSAANLGSVTVKRGHKELIGTGLISSINRYFNISPTNNSSLNAKLVFYYKNAELNTQNEADLVLYKSTDNGTSWSNQSFSSKNAALNFVDKTNIDAFSIWTLSSAVITPLPITGLEFTAKRKENYKVELNWRTLSEYQNKGFYIERKLANEKEFSSIGFVESLSPDVSKTELKYQFIDENDNIDISYYRIKQVDLDGKHNYSKIVAIKNERKNTSLKLYPNPAISVLNIENRTGNEVEITNINGQLIQFYILKKNEIDSSIDLSNLPKGFYFLKAGTEVRKFLKQ